MRVSHKFLTVKAEEPYHSCFQYSEYRVLSLLDFVFIAWRNPGYSYSLWFPRERTPIAIYYASPNKTETNKKKAIFEKCFLLPRFLVLPSGAENNTQ